MWPVISFDSVLHLIANEIIINLRKDREKSIKFRKHKKEVLNEWSDILSSWIVRCNNINMLSSSINSVQFQLKS